MKKDYKRIPFDLEKAKLITKGMMKGRIVTTEGRKVRIICFDKKHEGLYKEYPIVALVGYDNGEIINTFNKKGNDGSVGGDLCIEIQTYFRNYSNFKPSLIQPCLVRNTDQECWKLRICLSREKSKLGYAFYGKGAYGWINKEYYTQYLPVSKITQRLLGTTKSYEQLIEELDKEL